VFKTNEKAKQLIAKFQRIVKHFKKSSKSLSILHQIQKKRGEKELNPIQKVKTRWNSTFYMLTRMVEMKESMKEALDKIDENLPEISRMEWVLGEDLIDK
jgi:hypothetical protein